MAYALQQLINGLTLGLIYGLIALGYTMVYGILGVINFAHGDIFMVGGFLVLIALIGLLGGGVSSLAIALPLALLVAMAINACYGWTLERVAYRKLRGAHQLAPLISAIGMSIILQNFVQISQGAWQKPMPVTISGGLTLLRQGSFPVLLSWVQIIIAMTTLVILAIFTFLITRTRLGRAMRACEQDRFMASLLGIDTNRTIAMCFMLGAGLAAVAGGLFLLYYGVIDFSVGFLIGIKAFTAAVLGGIGSLPGAVAGGLLIGLAETFWSAYGNAPYKDVAAFSILILVLIFKPAGLFGRTTAEKV